MVFLKPVFKYPFHILPTSSVVVGKDQGYFQEMWMWMLYIKKDCFFAA